MTARRPILSGSRLRRRGTRAGRIARRCGRLASHPDTVGHGRLASGRDERDDVLRPDARPLGPQAAEIDLLDRDRKPWPERVPADGRRARPQASGHRAVVGCIAESIQDMDTRDRGGVSTKPSTTWRRRPSEKFGTDSTSRATPNKIVTDRLAPDPPGGTAANVEQPGRARGPVAGREWGARRRCEVATREERCRSGGAGRSIGRSRVRDFRGHDRRRRRRRHGVRLDVRVRGPVRGSLRLLGPGFVAAIAYVDPGNFATNILGGCAVRLSPAVGDPDRQPHGGRGPVPVQQGSGSLPAGACPSSAASATPPRSAGSSGSRPRSWRSPRTSPSSSAPRSPF